VVEVPHVFYEERLVEVPQVQVAEVVKQVPVTTVQEVHKHIPSVVETKVIEKVVQVPSTLIQETAVEVPKVLQHEVVTQKASGNVQQRIVQTGTAYERVVDKEAVVTGVGESIIAGEYNAQVMHTREFPVTCEDVEISRIVTEELVSDEAPVVTTINLHELSGVEGSQHSGFIGGGCSVSQPVTTSRSLAMSGMGSSSVVLSGQHAMSMPFAPNEPMAGAAGQQFGVSGSTATTAMYGSSVRHQAAAGVTSYSMTSGAAAGVSGSAAFSGQGRQSFFDVLDRNHDGSINLTDFGQAFR